MPFSCCTKTFSCQNVQELKGFKHFTQTERDHIWFQVAVVVVLCSTDDAHVLVCFARPHLPLITITLVYVALITARIACRRGQRPFKLNLDIVSLVTKSSTIWILRLFGNFTVTRIQYFLKISLLPKFCFRSWVLYFHNFVRRKTSRF